jgi:hypothetical protein
LNGDIQKVSFPFKNEAGCSKTETLIQYWISLATSLPIVKFHLRGCQMALMEQLDVGIVRNGQIESLLASPLSQFDSNGNGE